MLAALARFGSLHETDERGEMLLAPGVRLA